MICENIQEQIIIAKSRARKAIWIGDTKKAYKYYAFIKSRNLRLLELQIGGIE